MEVTSEERHRAYLIQIALVAQELGYNIEFLNRENRPGEPDMILRNPRNSRKAFIEVEVTFQQQKGHQRKALNRWRRVQSEIAQGGDAVILFIGARRRDLISLCERAGIPNPEQEYGKRLFSCISYADQNEVRSILTRCLGDE